MEKDTDVVKDLNADVVIGLNIIEVVEASIRIYLG